MGFPSLKRLRSCHPGIICEQLEERIVLDAAIASADSHNTCDKYVCDSASVGNDPHQNFTDLVQGDVDTVSDSAAQVFQNDLNVVLISNAIDNIQGLSDAVSEKAEVVVFDTKNDDLNAVNALLKEMVDTSGYKIDTLTILAHGGEGRVSIGAEEFNFFNVDDSRLAFEQLGSFLTEDGQIQIYSCSLAADFFGQSVVEDIASYTQADVFASVDSTGGPNGDWDLEYATDSESSLVSILDTDRLSDLTTELAQPYPSYENNWATAMGKVLYFVDDDGMSGKELWRSDGTAAGTYMLKDINVGAQDSNPEELIAINGTLYFKATDGNTSLDHGIELWKSDGTEAGTVIVKDINPGNQSSDPTELTNVNGTLYFRASDGSSSADHGVELWRSDGTDAGTEMVADMSPGNKDSNPTELTNVNGVLYFRASDTNSAGQHGTELWRSDGTVLGTYMVKDINVGQGDSDPTELTDINGILYFRATDGTAQGSHGVELWNSDGTDAGTVMVADMNVGKGDSNPSGFTEMNGLIYFQATDGNSGTDHGVELWASDGTKAGTYMVEDINPGKGDSNPEYLTDVDGVLYFSADDGVHGKELWMSDGTSTGTVLVNDILPGAQGSEPRFIWNYDGVAVLVADDGVHGYEPWQSDGSVSGTYLLKDINPTGPSFPIDHARVNPLFFLADSGNGNGYELWKSDGTEVGTVRVSDVKDAPPPTPPPPSPGGQGSGDPGGGDKSGGDQGGSDQNNESQNLIVTSNFSSEQNASNTSLSQSLINTGPTTKPHSEVSQFGYDSAESYSGPHAHKGISSSTNMQSENQTGTIDVASYVTKESKSDSYVPMAFVPGMVKVVVLSTGQFSVLSDRFSIIITSDTWLPRMVDWYLRAVSEGRYRAGLLPPEYESMIWDYLTYLEKFKSRDKKSNSETELKLAWQWAQWRKEAFKQNGNKDILPWSYFQGLAKALIAFYGKQQNVDIPFDKAVGALHHNVTNLSIVPIKIPEGEPGAGQVVRPGS